MCSGNMFTFIRRHLNMNISTGLLINYHILAVLLCGLVGGEKRPGRVVIG